MPGNSFCRLDHDNEDRERNEKGILRGLLDFARRAQWVICDAYLVMVRVRYQVSTAGVARERRISLAAFVRRLRPRSFSEHTMKPICAVAALLTAFSFVNILCAEVIVQPPDLEPGDQYRLIFTTSQRRDASSSDINVYNDYVQSVADSSAELAGLNVEWRAIGWTETVSAVENTMTNFTEEDRGLPIYRVDGLLWSPDYPTLWGPRDGPRINLAVNELGHEITDFEINSSGQESIFVWTGQPLPSRDLTLGSESTATVGDALISFRSTPGGLVMTSSFTSSLNRFYAISSTITAQVPEASSYSLALSALPGFLVLLRDRCRKPGLPHHSFC